MHPKKCAHCNTYHQTIDEVKYCNDLIDTKTGKKEIMKPFNPGDKVRSKAKPHITGTVKWVRFEPNGVSVNRQSSRGKWNYVQKIPKGGYTVSINWDPVPQIGYYPERPLHGLQGSTTIELVPQENVNQQTINNEGKEAMSNQPTTIREVNPMKQCKHQVWDWKLIPGQVNTDYKAVYCELCGEQLAQLAPKNKPMTDKQIKFIRSLFLEVKSNMTIDEQESLTTKMKAHIDGTNVLTTKWASAAIDKLKTYKPKPVKPVQVMEEDEPFGKVECHVCGTKYQPEEMGGSGAEVFMNGCIACL
jgi:hypothetical protein